MRLTLQLALALLLGASLSFGATYNAATCSRADVQTAINAEIASGADGDIINIPACSPTTWTGSSALVATFTHSVTIQGAGAVYSNAGGGSTTGSDATVILDNVTASSVLIFNTVAGKSFRLTGIALEQNSSSVAHTAMVDILGASTSVRVDHCHFYSYVSGNQDLEVGGSVQGVADHDWYDARAGIVTNDLAFYNGATWNGSSDGLGDASWSDTDHFGTSQFFFAEDSRFTGGWISDCVMGGRFVLRYSTGINFAGMANHGTHDQYRSCRAAEIYQSTFDDSGQTGGSGGNPVYSNNGGPALVWGNSSIDFRWIVGLAIVRLSSATYSIPAPPNGWGYCGTSSGPSVWDQNTSSSGYACIDSPGRGAGDLITGSIFPGIVNSTTGTQTWPHQALDPVYVWGNTYSDNGHTYATEGYAGDFTGGNIAVNRDFYQQFGTHGESGSWNGTKGVGQGLYSARGATCTAGPGGNTPGVAYWATDQNTLYVCNPTNVWTAVYTPYTYPHPLTNPGGGHPYNATMSESHSTTDSMTRKASYGRKPTDTNSAADSVARHGGLHKTMAESGSASDVLAEHSGFFRATQETNQASETLTATSGPPPGYTVSLVETNTASDALARQVAMARSASESGTASDTLANQEGYSRSVSEVATLSDSLARNAGLRRAPAETVTASDAMSRQTVLTRAALESGATTETVTASKQSSPHFSANIVESGSTSDSLVRQAGFARAAAETSAASDSMGRKLAAVRTESETNVVADAVGRKTALHKAMSESGTASDTLAESSAFLRSPQESQTVSETLTATTGTTPAFAVSLVETNTAGDAVVRTVAYFRGMTEAGGVSDALGTAQAYVRGMSETMSFSDAVGTMKSGQLLPTGPTASPH